MSSFLFLHFCDDALWLLGLYFSAFYPFRTFLRWLFTAAVQTSTGASRWSNRACEELPWCSFPYPASKTAHRATQGRVLFFPQNELTPPPKGGGLSLIHIFVPLLLVLLLNGSSDSMSKIFAQTGSRTDDGLFLFCIFASAGLFTLFPLFRSHKRLEKKDWLFGIAVGVPNFMSARFLLAALTELPAFVAYPTYSVGAIVVISLFSFLLFREKLSKLQLAGVGIILAALVLLNL